MEFINQMEPSFDEHERDALNNYLISGGWGTEFKQTRAFEEMIKDYTGAKHCWIMANGTVSLSAALMAVGVVVGDEVEELFSVAADELTVEQENGENLRSFPFLLSLFWL